MQTTFDRVSGDVYALTAFVVGQRGQEWALVGDEKKGAAKVVEDVARTYGCDAAKHPIDVIVSEAVDGREVESQRAGRILRPRPDRDRGRVQAAHRPCVLPTTRSSTLDTWRARCKRARRARTTGLSS